MSWTELMGRIEQARGGHQRTRELLTETQVPQAEITSSPIAEVYQAVEGAALDQLQEDARKYNGNFPPNYYETISRHLFQVALENNGGDPYDALLIVHAIANDHDDFSREFQSEYERLVGTDSENGWDKVRHFTACAFLQYKHGTVPQELFAHGKEILDEIESWFGGDPEGYSSSDIYADNRGQIFAEEIRRGLYDPNMIV
ncbi:hypothetical protein IFO70_29560 [Phormidium tenue FACHB-886]|nr:hypothetical protein [Phormidium tenue FACHB-886]